MADTATALRLERTFDAPREDVFDAWTNPEVLRRWWAGGPDWDTPSAEVDLREGGRYRLAMRNPEGDVHVVGGEYREIRRPERLVYTWAWEGPNPFPGESEVAVDFVEDGGRTKVVIEHSGFDSPDHVAPHEHGWNGVLANLEARVFA
jgi:uncharacterized protein YndB with AHSA1/START domain